MNVSPSCTVFLTCTLMHSHTQHASYLQGVLAKRRLEPEGGPRTFSHQTITQDNLIKLCFRWGPLNESYGVRHIPHNQLCGSVNHCMEKRQILRYVVMKLHTLQPLQPHFTSLFNSVCKCPTCSIYFYTGTVGRNR